MPYDATICIVYFVVTDWFKMELRLLVRYLVVIASFVEVVAIMKVALITGSYPPDICGVADYTAQLSESLERAGASVSIFSRKRWDLANAVRLRKELVGLNADVVHMQYPTRGYGYGLAPQCLSLLSSFVVTLHECSQAHILRQVSLYPFTIRTSNLIFTNEYERDYLRRFAPWLASKSSVIPIGTNVPVQPGSIERQADVVTYFGLIRPRKGLESVIKAAQLLQLRQSHLTVRIVGTVMPGHEQYYASLRRQAEGFPIDWQLGLTGSDLSCALAQTSIAYLPLPDGASERRSTLIAMLSNGAVVITTNGPQTPPSMHQAVLFADSAEHAVVLAEKIARDSEKLAAQRHSAIDYAARYSWDYIAAEHLAIYHRVAAL